MSEPPPPTREELAALVDSVFDFVCTQRLADFVDPNDVLPVLDLALTPTRLAGWITRWIAPQRERLLAHAKESETPLGAWLPDDARAELEAMAKEPAPLPPRLVDEAIASERVRDEVRAMLQDTLSSFVHKALGREEEKAGLRGALGRSAIGFAAAGKSLLGGIGDQVKKQLEERARDFVDGSVAAVQTRIADKLKSSETAENLGKRRHAWFVRTLGEPEREAAKLVSGAPHAKIDALVPRIVAHNLARPALRDLIRSEVAAVVSELSKQTLGELLDEGGLRESTRALAKARLVPMLELVAKSGGLPLLLRGVTS